MITIAEIDNLAALARIKLDDGEKAALQKDIGAILEYVKQVKNISVAQSTPEETGLVNVFREDENPHESGLYTDALLAAAPRREGQYIKVKKIL